MARPTKLAGEPGSRTTTWIIVLGFAFALVDRVDLLRGGGSFALTPFLALSPVLVLMTSVRWLRGNAPPTPELVSRGLTRVSLFVFLVFISLFQSQTGKGLSRFTLLVVLVAGGWALITLVRWSGNTRAVRLGALLGLGLYVVIDLVQWVEFHRHGLSGPEFSGFLNVGVTPYGHGVIRLTGGSLDANRAAMAIATYTFLVLADPVTMRRRVDLGSLLLYGISATLVTLTLSRSGVLAFILITFGVVGTVWRAQSRIGRFSIIVLVGALARYVYVQATATGSLADTVLHERLSQGEGSAESHIDLLSRGWQHASMGWHFIAGWGYGESFLYLQDVFPGNAYGNYHSMYITVLAECGLLALIALLFVLVPPIAGPRRWLVLGMLVFGAFYQNMSDAVFWIQVALLWALPVSIPIGGTKLQQPDERLQCECSPEPAVPRP